MENISNSAVDYYRVGHRSYPDGCVIVTDENGTTEYTLDEWHALQQSPPQE